MHEAATGILIGALAAVALFAAILVYAGRPRHPSNRYLALALHFHAAAETSNALRDLHLTNVGTEVVSTLRELSLIVCSVAQGTPT